MQIPNYRKEITGSSVLVECIHPVIKSLLYYIETRKYIQLYLTNITCNLRSFSHVKHSAFIDSLINSLITYFLSRDASVLLKVRPSANIVELQPSKRRKCLLSKSQEVGVECMPSSSSSSYHMSGFQSKVSVDAKLLKTS